MVKKNAEKDVGFVRQFNELKKKHPDAVNGSPYARR